MKWILNLSKIKQEHIFHSWDYQNHSNNANFSRTFLRLTSRFWNHIKCALKLLPTVNQWNNVNMVLNNYTDLNSKYLIVISRTHSSYMYLACRKGNPISNDIFKMFIFFSFSKLKHVDILLHVILLYPTKESRKDLISWACNFIGCCNLHAWSACTWIDTRYSNTLYILSYSYNIW